ncbi:MAG: hypothetical protein A2142_08665 [candidate division Zixibacteria bacterium RBG_16_48_11]|nr:MAG: hypothetical protein A2142_08665 [candidate division Zixibacteria bacterium RBG_16_48_11]
MRIQLPELFFLPNLLTFLRTALIPVVYYLLLENQIAWAVGLGAFMMATDILDGLLARKLNQASELGKILDPLSDKAAIALFSIYVVIYKGFPLWAAALIIARDLGIILTGVLFSRKTKQVPVSNFLGKITALSWGILLVVYVVGWKTGQAPLLILSLVLWAASVYSYTRTFIFSLRSD